MIGILLLMLTTIIGVVAYFIFEPMFKFMYKFENLNFLIIFLLVLGIMLMTINLILLFYGFYEQHKVVMVIFSFLLLGLYVSFLLSYIKSIKDKKQTRDKKNELLD